MHVKSNGIQVEGMLSFSNYSNAHHSHSHLQDTSYDTLGFDADVTDTNTGQAARKKRNEREKNKLRQKNTD